MEERKANIGINVSHRDEVLFGGVTVNAWNSKWQSIGNLKTANLTPYNKYIGLYRHKVGGKIMYVGRGNRIKQWWIRKDYRRESDSVRKHKSGKLIYENLDRITTDILIIGDSFEAVKITRLLERQFIEKFNPPWNKQKVHKSIT
ncbi:hypothetical protein AB4Y30_04950 [Ornithinibacillus sp. 4-3]|uniref:GIY-YIG domain-containing protein n=1 Tax=Ornithinibacillus sp. 4-3 TaxID=3231488 RepID=A0AB39HVA8_9BACI